MRATTARPHAAPLPPAQLSAARQEHFQRTTELRATIRRQALELARQERAAAIALFSSNPARLPPGVAASFDQHVDPIQRARARIRAASLQLGPPPGLGHPPTATPLTLDADEPDLVTDIQPARWQQPSPRSGLRIVE
ncbi:MAG: hypothetical protein ACK4NM_19220, partial [Hydrogenophaga sp.]